MPCSDNGQDEYDNLQDYGVATSSANIATMVACEAMKLLGPEAIRGQGSAMLRTWAAKHAREDKA